MSPLAMGSPCRRIQDPVAFTCAMLALVEQSAGDRAVSPAVLTSILPYTRSEPVCLPPSFFRAVQRFREQQLRMEVA